MALGRVVRVSTSPDLTGPLADASVRRAGANDAPAVGRVQAAVFRETYAGRLPDDVLARSITRYGAETGLVATGFLATAVDGART